MDRGTPRRVKNRNPPVRKVPGSSPLIRTLDPPDPTDHEDPPDQSPAPTSAKVGAVYDKTAPGTRHGPNVAVTRSTLPASLINCPTSTGRSPSSTIGYRAS